MKKELLKQMREYGYVVDYTTSSEDWQDIANELGEEVYFDDFWGIAFTKSYANKHMQMVEPKKKGGNQ